MNTEPTIYHMTVSVTGCASANTRPRRDGQVNYGEGSISSYDGLGEFVAQHRDEIMDGATVVDLQPLADRDDIVRLAWQCPMTAWHPRARVRLDADDIFLLPVAAWTGAFGVAAMTSPADVRTGLDDATSSEVAHYWRSFGARVGFWDATAGEVVWP